MFKPQNLKITMSLSLPFCRPSSSPLQCARSPVFHTQIRHATFIRRPKRPYTFTQLVTLSDGSSFTHRTTSPEPIYTSNKDTRNALLWNPTNRKLINYEADEAGKLRAFRKKFGRGWDAEEIHQGEDEEAVEKNESLMDLITGSGGEENDGWSREMKGKGTGDEGKK